jgi:hypothetical protein
MLEADREAGANAQTGIVPLSAMSYDEFDDENHPRRIGGREGLTGYDVSPIAIYVSKGRLCARLPCCPHRGWVSYSSSLSGAYRLPNSGHR